MAHKFWPTDTDTEFYMAGDRPLFEVLNRIKDKWPNAKPEDVLITPENIQVDCMTYDRYDSSDYKNFLCISLIQ